MTHRSKYELIIVDLMLPDAPGFSGFLHLQAQYQQSHLAALTCVDTERLPYIARALGAVGYLTKTMSLDTLAEAVARMARGEQFYPPMLDELPPMLMSLRARLGTLSPAQRRVMFGLADGRLNKQIAASLEISEATVKAHLTSIYRKLQVCNRAQALLLLQPALAVMPSVEIAQG